MKLPSQNKGPLWLVGAFANMIGVIAFTSLIRSRSVQDRWTGVVGAIAITLPVIVTVLATRQGAHERQLAAQSSAWRFAYRVLWPLEFALALFGMWLSLTTPADLDHRSLLLAVVTSAFVAVGAISPLRLTRRHVAGLESEAFVRAAAAAGAILLILSFIGTVVALYTQAGSIPNWVLYSTGIFVFLAVLVVSLRRGS